MSVQENGITLSPKVLLGIVLAGAGTLISVGGYLASVKEAPKDISALSRNLKEFKRDSHGVHHETDERLRKVESTQVRLETNQIHMLTGIDDIKGMLRRSGRRHTRRSEEDGG